MKLKTSIALTLPSLTLLAAALHAAEVAPTAPDASSQPASSTAATVEAPANAAEAETTNTRTVTTVITPRLFGFHTFEGWWGDRANFLERYDYRESFDDDNRTGVYADLDLDVTVNNGERDEFVLERRGFGEHNHRGFAKYGNDSLNVYGNYSHYRSATGGIDYLYRPSEPELDKYGTGGTTAPGSGQQQGGGFVSNFTDLANRYDYTVDRTTYGAGFKIKPTALGGMATLAVDYSGYRRDGNKFAPFLLDGGGNQQPGGASTRWRGINLDIDERMNRVGMTLTASPQKLFEIAYEVSYEEFDNRTAELQMQPLTGETNPDPAASLFYVPDTNLTRHGIRFSKNFDNRVMLAAGYGASWLKQDSFSAYETANGHTTGEVRTDNAYLTLNGHVSPDVSVEGYIKYYQHENNSSFEDRLINTTTLGQLVAPRINGIDSMDYGLSASWRAEAMKSGFTAGWRRLDRERDLTWGPAGVTGAGQGQGNIQPAQSLYREDTLSDEVYFKWSARPAQNWMTEIKPSYLWADKTGLVTEPEEAFLLKTKATYSAPEGWVATGFYDYKRRQNSNNTFSNGTTAPTAATYAQDIDSTLHSAGVSLNIMPRDDMNVTANLYWMQDDFSSYLFTTSAARWNPGVVFTLVDEPNYKIDSWVFSLGNDWQYNEKLKLAGSYTYTRSKGDVASGTVFTQLQAATGTIDSIIDSSLHSVSLSADYSLSEKATLRVNYIFDYYDDNAYDLLTNGANTLAIGVSYAM